MWHVILQLDSLILCEQAFEASAGSRGIQAKSSRVIAPEQARQILSALSALPPDKVNEVQDYVLFLKARYGIDERTDWTPEDMHDLTSAVLDHADRSL